MENLPPNVTIEEIETEIAFLAILINTMDKHSDEYHSEKRKRERQLHDLTDLRQRKLHEPPRPVQPPRPTSSTMSSTPGASSSAFGQANTQDGLPLTQYTNGQINQNARGRIPTLPSSRSLGKHGRSEDSPFGRSPSAANKSVRMGLGTASASGHASSPGRLAPGRIPSASATPNGSRHHARSNPGGGPQGFTPPSPYSNTLQTQAQNLSLHSRSPILPPPHSLPHNPHSITRGHATRGWHPPRALPSSAPRQISASTPGPASQRRNQQLPGFSQVVSSATRPVEVIELSSDSDDSEPETLRNGMSTPDAQHKGSKNDDEGKGAFTRCFNDNGFLNARNPSFSTNRPVLGRSTPSGVRMYNELHSRPSLGYPAGAFAGDGLASNSATPPGMIPRMPGAYPSDLPTDMNSWDQPHYGRQGASEEDITGLLNNVRDAGDDLPKDQRPATPEALVHPLLEHQKIGLHWLKKMEASTTKGGILADDMGLGKTLQALALVVERPSTDPQRKTTLIIAPVALMYQWALEIKTKIKTGPHALKVMIYHGTGKNKKTFKQLSENDIVLTSFGTVASEWGKKSDVRKLEYDSDGRAQATYYSTALFGHEAHWHRIILDEAQNIKNKETKTSKAVNELNATYRLCMTGTPMMNRVDELYPMLRFLKTPSYEEWSVFKNDVKTPLESDKERGIQKLRTLLKATLLRRNKDSIVDGRPILELPPKTISFENVEFDEDQREFYNAIEHRTQLRFNKYLREGTVGTQYTQILVLLLRLRQACCHPNLIRDFAEKIPTDLNNNDLSEFAEKLSPDVVRRIKEENGAFSCPICLDGTANPAIFFPCGHTACSECFATLTEPARAQAADGLRCPECRGNINAKEITDYNAFKKVHQPDLDQNAELNELLGQGSDEDSDSDENEDEEEGESSSGSKGKGRAMPKPTLNELRKNANRNKEAKKKYFARLAKKWVSSSKIDRTMELLRGIRSNDQSEKTLIFSQFTGLLDLLELPLMREDMGYVRYDGGMSAKTRDEAVQKFTTDPDTKVMLVSLKAGNSGLNLVEASRVIILDPFWNPYIEYQAIDRAHRIGQRRPVTVHRILVPDTVEDRIMTLQKQKEELITAALDEGQMKNVGRLNDQELRYLFGLGRR
ncbi:SNF2 family N-terminal domain-containing protein [Phyllosticta citrichinensis]|uniref:SNF2 family N-terminal domain-containing protein n=1 Tax=Phyllosticta citrichinensis TaxID=1130410 RepID=A0ABR1XR53_9PEZI